MRAFRRNSSAGRWIAVCCLSTLIAVAGVVLFLAGEPLGVADNWASVLGLVLGLLVGPPGLVVSYAGLRIAQREEQAAASATSREEQLLEQLASMVREQWKRERAVRDLNNDVLPVRWAPAAAELMDRREQVFGWEVPDGAAGKLLSGWVGGVVGAFRRLPAPRRLVVLGEPGAGKTVTAIELTLGLLEDRAAGEPVPVILPIASWVPAKEELVPWIAHVLTETYPALGTPTGGKRTVADQLVRTGGILPVFDGLDEMAASARADAVRAINRWWGSRTESVVLTCRTSEYRTLFAADHGDEQEPEHLAGAAVVELQPLDPSGTLEYLRRSTPHHSAGKWDPLAERVSREPDGPLAAALGNPLLAGLARATYSKTKRHPEELLDERLATQQDIEDHLFEQFVPAVYSAESQVGADSHWDPARAKRWLQALAWQLEQRKTQEIRWWELPLMVSRLTFVTTVGLVFAMAGGLAGVLLTVLAPRTQAGSPFANAGAFETALAGLGFGLLVGAVVVLAGRQASSPSRTELLLPRRLAEVNRAVRLVFAGIGSSLAIGFGVGLLFGYFSLVVVNDSNMLAEGIAMAPVIAVSAAPPLVLVSLLTTPVDLDRAPAPRATLRADRVRALLVCATVVAVAGPLLWVQLAPLIGVFLGLGLGLTLWVLSAWGSLAILRGAILLKWPSRLPVRIFAFLDDAHKRGVLRQVGTTYQFRHLNLRNHLARSYPRSGDRAKAGHRESVALLVIYWVALIGGLGAAVPIYLVLFDLFSESTLTRIAALWLFPIVFGFYGLVSEALIRVARKRGLESVADAASSIGKARGRWVLPVVLPFIVLRWRNPLLVVLATTAFWALLVQWFLVAIFPLL